MAEVLPRGNPCFYFKSRSLVSPSSHFGFCASGRMGGATASVLADVQGDNYSMGRSGSGAFISPVANGSTRVRTGQ
jgi:hypothetical protein